MNHPSKPSRPFRRAVLRGLGILMPPLLTIVLFIWAWSVIEDYILNPAESVAGQLIVFYTGDVLTEAPGGVDSIEEDGKMLSFRYNNRFYTRDSDRRWIGYYSDEYVRDNYLRRSRVLPIFISAFLLVLYLLGKFVAAGVGRMIVSVFDSLVHRLPLVSNVYSSVKQVTDFVFSEREIEFNRVVAIEYPRKGVWSIGFVTGESMLDIRSAANEPVLSVLMPTSPMPMTGFTITVLKSEAVDLNITVDQAIQFVISCGVVVPYQQQQPLDGDVTLKITSAMQQATGTNGRDARPGVSDAQKETRESGD